MKTAHAVMLALVLLALTLSAHGNAQFISIPLIGEESGKTIEGNPGMVITASDAAGTTFEFDTIPTISQPSRIRLDITLFNLAVRPEADSTLGVAIGTAGCISEEEWRARAAAEKQYNEKTRGELRQANLGSIDYPGRWITAIRTGRVDFRKQRAGQNGPLAFTAFIEPKDLKTGLNTFVIRVHGIMEQRTKRVLVLAKDGKSIFGTYDEPWLINVESACQSAGPRPPIVIKQEDAGWQAPETNWDQPPAPLDPAPTIPTIGIKFNVPEGAAIGRQTQVKVSFEPGLPAGSWVESCAYANGQWSPWRKVSSPSSGRGTFASPSIRLGPVALAVRVVNAEGQELGSAQLNLALEDR